jgi:hypothetical protein
MAERLPFQLDEEQILDLLEILDHVYQPPECIERFQKKLRGGRDYFIEKRLAEEMKESESEEPRMPDDMDAALVEFLREEDA